MTDAPAPAYNQPAAQDPGKTLGIVALILVFFFSIVGLILGYVARSQSTKAGFTNTPAKVAIILGWIFVALTVVWIVILIVIAASATTITVTN